MKAVKDCGNEGFVTANALRKHLTDDLWKDLDNESSLLIKILQSSHFKRPESS